MTRSCLLILGMHRSGTSALTRLCALAGAALPEKVIEAREGNPTGHWESQALADHHEKLLASMGQSWDDFRRVEFSDAETERYQADVGAILDRDFGDAALTVVKEPRLSRFPEPFIALLEHRGTQVCPVHIIRHPLEVAQSLHARNGTPLAVGALIWLRHVIDVETALAGRKRWTTSYVTVLESGAREVRRIFRHFGLPEPDGDFEADAADFIDPGLRHHSDHDWSGIAHLQSWLEPIYTALAETGGGEDSALDTDGFAAVQREFEATTGVLHGFRRQLDHAIAQLADARLTTEEREKAIEELRLSAAEEAEDAHERLEDAKASFSAQIEERDALLRTKDDLIYSRNRLLEEKDALIRAKSQIISERESALSEQLAVFHAEAQSARDLFGEQLASAEAAFAAQLEEYDALLRTKDDLIYSRNKLFEEKDEVIRNKDAVIAERGERIANLQRAVADLEADIAGAAEELSALAAAKSEFLERDAAASERAKRLRASLVASEAMLEAEHIRADELERERDALARSAEELRESRNAASERVGVLEAASDELEAARTALAERDRSIDSLRAQLRAEHDIVRSRNGRVEAMRASTSWRITRPLRRAKRLWENRTRVLFGLIAGRDVRGLMLNTDVDASVKASRSEGVSESRRQLAGGRRHALERPALLNRYSAASPELPRVTISAVLYNSEVWLWNFFLSLESLDYPKELMSVHFVDNGSTDGTIKGVEVFIGKMRGQYRRVELSRRPNLGYGAGNDWAVRNSDDPFVLVTNVDAEFYPSSLRRCVEAAVLDSGDVACWEFRQAPFEHPKYYDPVTLETGWNAHACVLLRRSAYEAVGGYDKKIFMYGEDVELSFRFRAHGWKLRYVPEAVIVHHVDLVDASKRPHQLSGSTAANVLLRYRYGSYRDIGAGEALLRAVRHREDDPARGAAFDEAMRIVNRNRRHFWQRRPARKTLQRSGAVMPFNEFDYDLARPGGDVPVYPFRASDAPHLPLVTVVTRTHGPSDAHLVNAMASVLNQTYPNVEHVIVEDRTDDARALVEAAADTFGTDRIRYVRSLGTGRSDCGNSGAEAARGEWLCWLDNDDLLFADHVEALMRAALASPDTVASYAMAWDALVDADDGSAVAEFRLPHAHTLPYDRERLLKENFIPIQAIVFRKRLFDEYGGFNPNFSQLEDWNLWARYSHAGDFVFTPKVTSIYFTPADSEVRQRRHLALHDAYETVRDANFRDVADIRHRLGEGSGPKPANDVYADGHTRAGGPGTASPGKARG